jgi:hypothetical protein
VLSDSDRVLPARIKAPPLQKMVIYETCESSLNKFSPLDAYVLTTSFAGQARAVGFSRTIVAKHKEVDVVALYHSTKATSASDSVFIVYDFLRGF